MEILLLVQLNNGYADYYYITEQGQVYNTAADSVLNTDKSHCVKLKRTDGTYKKVSIKTLYRAAYGKAYAKDNIKSLDGEEWKAIDSACNYFVSNKGRVKTYTGIEARLMKPYSMKSGYLRLDIIEDGVRSSRLLHRLVAAAFLPPPVKTDYQLHHKDFDKLNNAADNLEWLSITDHVKKHKERSEAAADGYIRKPKNDNNEESSTQRQ